MGVSLGWRGWKRGGESRDLYWLKGSLDEPEIVQQSPQQAPRWNVEQSISPQEGYESFRRCSYKAPGLEMIANFIADPGNSLKIRLGLDPN